MRQSFHSYFLLILTGQNHFQPNSQRSHDTNLSKQFSSRKKIKINLFVRENKRKTFTCLFMCSSIVFPSSIFCFSSLKFSFFLSWQSQTEEKKCFRLFLLRSFFYYWRYSTWLGLLCTVFPWQVFFYFYFCLLLDVFDVKLSILFIAFHQTISSLG